LGLRDSLTPQKRIMRRVSPLEIIELLRFQAMLPILRTTFHSRSVQRRRPGRSRQPVALRRLALGIPIAARAPGGTQSDPRWRRRWLAAAARLPLEAQPHKQFINHAGATSLPASEQQRATDLYNLATAAASTAGNRWRRAWRWMRATGCLAGAGLLLVLATGVVGAQQVAAAEGMLRGHHEPQHGRRSLGAVLLDKCTGKTWILSRTAVPGGSAPRWRPLTVDTTESVSQQP